MGEPKKSMLLCEFYMIEKCNKVIMTCYVEESDGTHLNVVNCIGLDLWKVIFQKRLLFCNNNGKSFYGKIMFICAS